MRYTWTARLIAFHLLSCSAAIKYGWKLAVCVMGRKSRCAALPPSFLTLLSACLPPVLASPHTEYPAHQNGEPNGRTGSLPDACRSSSSCFAISTRSTESKCHKRTSAHGYTANVHEKYRQISSVCVRTRSCESRKRLSKREQHRSTRCFATPWASHANIRALRRCAANAAWCVAPAWMHVFEIEGKVCQRQMQECRDKRYR